MSDSGTKASLNFIQEIVEDDLRTGKWGGRVHTRFPPEPNGCMHIGHAKGIWLSFGLALKYGGKYNLRFDDTNPVKEEQQYVEAITEDIAWLGFDLEGRILFGSDYFRQMYDWAVQLIKAGKAYVCDLSPEQTREYRGSLTTPGRNSPFRDRSVEENLDLFERMRAGEFPDGSRTLRAKIDMASPNFNLRDPVMYRVLHATHHRTGDAWCVYPMYDWAHGLEDSIEGITHSICSLEFENHRPLYDWFLDQLGIHHPQQIEYARMELTYTVMSKRKLLELVQGGQVTGWDDPRLPTLSGLRRRGYTPESIRNFCERIGVAKMNSTIDIALLEHCVREHLNKAAPRAMCVLKPLKVVIENYPKGQSEELEAINNPEDESAGTRMVPFSRELYIEQDDFREDPPRKFFRLAPGREVRLRYAYFITSNEVIKNDAGEVVELRCTYDPATKGGDAPDGRKVKATLHWVSANHAVDTEVRLYDHLFTKENPTDAPEGHDWKENLNPDSLEVLTGCKLEPTWNAAGADLWSDNIHRVQFERQGYFCVDADTTDARPVFNRTVTLKDSWAKVQRTQLPKQRAASTLDAEVRAELRAILRAYKDVYQPIRHFDALPGRGESEPRHYVMFDRDPHKPVGGLRIRSGSVALPDERIIGDVLQFAQVVWHFKDWLKKWAKVRDIPTDVEEWAERSERLLICADLANRKKHGGHTNRSGRNPELGVIGAGEGDSEVAQPGLVRFDTSASGVLELFYNGASKEKELLVQNPVPLPFRIDVLADGGPVVLGDAAELIYGAFRDWLPLVRTLGLLAGDDRESADLRKRLGFDEVG